MRTVAVTGARGYVGSTVARSFRAAGWDVRELTRDVLRLEDAPPQGLFAGVDVVVHCAWDFDARTRAAAERVNVAGSRRLLEEAGRAGARTIFLSTLSGGSVYGEAKRAVEPAADVVVRPGLVWGPYGGSLYGALRRLSRLPLLPALSGAPLYLAHEDDLAALVLHVADAEPPLPPVVAASPEPLSLAEVLRRLNPHARVVTVPWRLVWAPLRALELAGVRGRLRSDGVLGLVGADRDPFASAAAPPTPFRRFEP